MGRGSGSGVWGEWGPAPPAFVGCWGLVRTSRPMRVTTRWTYPHEECPGQPRTRHRTAARCQVGIYAWTPHFFVGVHRV